MVLGGLWHLVAGTLELGVENNNKGDSYLQPPGLRDGGFHGGVEMARLA